MAKADEIPKVKFDFTLQKNICMFLKRNEGQCSVEDLQKNFISEGEITVRAMLVSLKQKKYVSYDERNVYLSDNLYYLLQA
jgi:hypothetical protein